MDKKRVLLTGADGLLGNNIVRELLARNYKTRAFIQPNRNTNTLADHGIEIVYGDILNKEDVLKAAHGCEYIIHAAANTAIWPYRSEIIRKVNHHGTINVINAAKENNITRLVAIGTANSFGNGTESNPGTEEFPFTAGKFGLDYIDSKLDAQKAILDAVTNDNLDAIILNPTFMLGPYDTKPSSGELLLALYHGKVPGYTAGGKNYIHVQDVATAACNGLTMGRSGECYLMANENLSYKDFNTLVSAELGVKPPRIYVPKFIILFYGLISEAWARIIGTTPSISYAVARISLITNYYTGQKAIEELNLPQTPIKNAVKDAFDWFRTNGYLEKK